MRGSHSILSMSDVCSFILGKPALRRRLCSHERCSDAVQGSTGELLHTRRGEVEGSLVQRCIAMGRQGGWHLIWLKGPLEEHRRQMPADLEMTLDDPRHCDCGQRVAKVRSLRRDGGEVHKLIHQIDGASRVTHSAVAVLGC